MQQLREGGLYALPDESEVIAVANLRGAYLLYTPHDWTLYPHVSAIYEIHASGQLYYRGEPTYWRIGDLSDTGRMGTSSGSR
jgi:hypothetical protein